MHRLNQPRWRVALVAALAVLFIAGTAACSKKPDGQSSRASEVSTQTKSYQSVVAQDPAHAMTYSPTRKTINKWIDTWNVKGQLAFTYLLNNAGAKVGYFVFDGAPVSMCASLTPTWTYEGTPRDGSDTLDQRVPAPSIDGVYYSGGQCLSYYGIDATTGRYLEFSIGGAQNYITSTQPLDLAVPALGYTKVADLHKVRGKYVMP